MYFSSFETTNNLYTNKTLLNFYFLDRVAMGYLFLMQTEIGKKF